MVSLFSRSVGVGRCFPEKVGVRCRCWMFFKELCTANAATNAVPGSALMLRLASSLPPHTRSLEEGEGMGGGTTDTASEYDGQVPSPASNV